MSAEILIAAWCRSYKGDEHIDPLVKRGHPLRLLAERIDKAMADAERAAQAAAFEKAELVALRYRDEADAGKHPDIGDPEHSLGQAFAANVIAKRIRARTASSAAPQEPDRAAVARVVAMLLDEAKTNTEPRNIVHWLSETLAHYAGGGS